MAHETHDAIPALGSDEIERIIRDARRARGEFIVAALRRLFGRPAPAKGGRTAPAGRPLATC